jgi:hypothetical protein
MAAANDLSSAFPLGAIDDRRRAMFHHTGRHDIAHGVELVVRANRAASLSLFWGLLLACVLGSLVFDVGRWLGVW